MTPTRKLSELTMANHSSLVLAERVGRIKPSPTLAISARAEELAAQGKNMISLSIGEPDFDTPEHIKEAAIKAIRDGHTKYTAVDGIKSLKQAVINKFTRDNRLKYELNQILVSCGAKHSLFNLFSAILNPGDEVIIPAPYWVSYPDMVMLADGQPVIVNTDFSHLFKMTPAQLESAITPKTRIVILNSPSNPTGIAYTAEELKALGEVILRHPGIIVASDDIYEHHLWNHTPFTNILNVCPELYDRCFVINGVSKTYAMTGWRIGYAAGPANIIGAMKKAQSQSTSNPTSVSQYAALAALEGDQSCVSMMTKAYKERHDFVVSELQKMQGIHCIPSDGTFYTLPSVEGLLNKQTGMADDMAFSEYLLNEAEIAVIPGSAFGAPGHIRLCFTTSMEKLVDAMQRMHKAIAKLLA
ncbi:pyridoxal phosphate-dependent aminotransferase [Aquicella lusitana]|uniref:Aminotransferase n=1 Tax=Aquicella lusitana TaxID=254246 RepID=A0A370GYV9_9COXI|nr:pyridoxal phosphate-dependent aminotransferase [Aquicella lusitana]RDI48833.1 aspartate aminotransferase [Aquicella lusitana]VVC73261.1 Aspartate aminotransferase [Aquicella lusitana]